MLLITIFFKYFGNLFIKEPILLWSFLILRWLKVKKVALIFSKVLAIIFILVEVPCFWVIPKCLILMPCTAQCFQTTIYIFCHWFDIRSPLWKNAFTTTRGCEREVSLRPKNDRFFCLDVHLVCPLSPCCGPTTREHHTSKIRCSKILKYPRGHFLRQLASASSGLWENDAIPLLFNELCH